jgi:uncharacterized repeat protein (TIGR01451 family)
MGGRTLSRRLGTGLVAVTLGMGVVVVAAAPALAATGTLDQVNSGPATGSLYIASSICDGDCWDYRIAETFTAGITGDLDTLQLNLWLAGGDPGDLVVKIQGTQSLADPGKPDDQDVLATQTVPQSAVPTTTSGVLTLAFTNPPAVVAGTKYAIVLTSTLGQINAGNTQDWYHVGVTYDTYAGDRCANKADGTWGCGSPWAPYDWVFATYVTAAPPGLPAASVSPNSLAFGSHPTGSTSTAQTVTVNNTASPGSQALDIGGLSTTGAAASDFTLSNDTCSGASVAAGASCTVDVSFAPTATGSRTATLQIPSNAASSPDLVTLSGTGTSLADVVVTMTGPTSAARGTSVAYVVTVTNHGPSSASNVVLTDSLSSGATSTGASASQGTCQVGKGSVTCSLGTLASGGSAGSVVSIKVVAKVGSAITNLASAASKKTRTAPATPDPDTSNNWASMTTTVSS